MTKDFIEYGYKEPICKIYHGQEVFDAPITVTTWQSFSKALKEVLESFDMVIGDEAHLFKAQTLKGILEKMKNMLSELVLQVHWTEVKCIDYNSKDYLGLVKKVISSAELIEEGTIADIKIDCLVLKHPKQQKMKYQDEMDYLVSCEERNKFIVNLVRNLKGNTLVLFNMWRNMV